MLGVADGNADGDELELPVGSSDGNAEGDAVGLFDGDELGLLVGWTDGDAEGLDDGADDLRTHSRLPTKSSYFRSQQHVAISQISAFFEFLRH